MIHYFVEDTRDEAQNAENRAIFEGLRSWRWERGIAACP
jgi:hypothetical protein